MPTRLPTAHLAALILLIASGVPAFAQSDTVFTASQIEDAGYDGGDLPPGRSALTAKVQVLLDRSGTSPGVIDGFKGGMSQSAIMAFERRSGLPMDGVMDPHVWNLLQSFAHQPITMEYTITPQDAEGLVDAIPADYAEKARMSSQGYTSIAERLGERFHMDEKFIAFLNPGVALEPGATIRVTDPGSPVKGQVTRIIVDKASRRVAGYNAQGRMIVDYPATIGSDATPSPSGDHHVVTVAMNPNYTYNPARNFKQGDNDKPLIVPPGPNGPVGSVWIDLSKPSYGIHGTATPSRLFHNQSHGCVRLTNWDAEELAGMVRANVTRVEFLEPGVTIADVTGVAPSAPVQTSQPLEQIAAEAQVTDGETPAADAAATAAPLDFPDDPGAQTGLAGASLHENTSEEEADAAAQPSSADPLSQALSGALPDGFVAPPLDEGQ
ncbi:murein L,D-transpeptidase [Paracoccus stylophorae]|uniref:Murein L,D-transpeptidase n=1 Tax=Paracoccus stylophorae TaxID=659350 RepID=A0ABY7STE6_9RHOB|nr:L,D-transpeptidase [Paracoccus stylophorae]WCR10213.1 murein L,D-transpeptidase [Paracoccus stylophorae]